ncbi:hypothetical protein FKG94_11730 [Exilibacterium tricleocarpae]|uniref:Uncharacterized protein n=1 Tax=Exilibacterium tricleocarpae TaxID=2591008 RepID=A0A545TN90_9GAMM|nr:hypothetical protein [Exilibacterium tricleocarpae]TQV78693.1 hypothetical protein FKG94_11730 [Exilibacterium tricleocarpae]
MNEQESLRLSFNIESKQLHLTRSLRERTLPPRGEKQPFDPIEPTIIGHWVEVKCDNGNTVYRRFLHNVLPLNYLVENIDLVEKLDTARESAGSADFRTTNPAAKGSRKRKPETTFEVVIPFPRDNCELIIYEQSLPGPDERRPRRREHIKLHLQACEAALAESV